MFEDYLLDLEKQHIIRIEDDKKIVYLEDVNAEFVYETDRDEEHVDDEETDRRAAFDVHMNKHIIGNAFIIEEYESDLYDFIDALFQRNDPRVTKVFVRSSHSNVLTKVPRSVNRAYKMNNISSDKGKLLIDGGCDTCLVGNGFIIESTTSRTVDVQGFADDIKVQSLPIVSAVTAVDVDGEVILLEIHECIAVENNQTSLLSTFQAREHGVVVNDIADRHGGKQNIEYDDDIIPLILEDGLFIVDIREPTVAERFDCRRLTLTSDRPWTVGECDNSSHLMTTESDFISIENALNTLIRSVHTATTSSVYPVTADVNSIEPAKFQAKLGWMPMQVIKETLKRTTQLAKNHLRLPLRKHFKSRFPQLNRNRLHETYSTDTIFSSVSSVGDKFTCAQIFSGKKSLFSKVYGMTTESEGPEALESFIADVGAPFHILSDNAKMETSKAWKDILRK